MDIELREFLNNRNKKKAFFYSETTKKLLQDVFELGAKKGKCPVCSTRVKSFEPEKIEESRVNHVVKNLARSVDSETIFNGLTSSMQNKIKLSN